MAFANSLPWWVLAPIIVAAGFVAWVGYSKRTLTPPRRAALVALRFVTLLALIVFLLRPVVRVIDADGHGIAVPVLIDLSRSMSIEDTPGRRIDRARAIVAEQLQPLLGTEFRVELFGFGESLRSISPAEFSAADRRSDVAAALSALRDKYRGSPVAGIVVLSDGGDTSGAADRVAEDGPPIYPIGIGSPTVLRDREIAGITAAEAVLDDARVDLEVAAVSHGFGVEPIELRLLENGRPVDVRQLKPDVDGAPVRAVFQVTPPPGAPTVYTIETPVAKGELVPENNSRSTLVQPPSRPRRVLVVEGAPGFEHSFLKRALIADSGLEIDSVVRKGRNEQGDETFYIQAAQARSENLRTGYPPTREALFAYDALVLANMEAHQFTSAQLDATRSFVAARGGGLLVLGAKSFLRQGLVGSVLEDVIPLEMSERGGDVDPPPSSAGLNRVALTPAGESHPIMQIAAALADTRKRWSEVPTLAAVSPLGGPRPGASVLAVTATPGGTPRALIAVQRFGEGRTMVFTGEASWRWKMLAPATDRSFETFWQQAVRWLALPAPEPIAIHAPSGGAPGGSLPVRVQVRNPAFAPIEGATVEITVSGPDGRTSTLSAKPVPGGEGQYALDIRPERAGVVRLTADVKQGAATLGRVSRSVLVGAADLEMADPRMNGAVLGRLAAVSRGRALSEMEIRDLPNLLKAGMARANLETQRDLWHTGWSFAAILVLLGAEWVLRRMWGLR